MFHWRLRTCIWTEALRGWTKNVDSTKLSTGISTIVKKSRIRMQSLCANFRTFTTFFTTMILYQCIEIRALRFYMVSSSHIVSLFWCQTNLRSFVCEAIYAWTVDSLMDHNAGYISFSWLYFGLLTYSYDNSLLCLYRLMDHYARSSNSI